MLGLLEQREQLKNLVSAARAEPNLSEERNWEVLLKLLLQGKEIAQILIMNQLVILLRG